MKSFLVKDLFEPRQNVLRVSSSVTASTRFF